MNNLSPETLALINAGILTPAVATAAGELMTDRRRVIAWQRHRLQAKTAATALAQFRRDWQITRR
jgi:hypothetical protein